MRNVINTHLPIFAMIYKKAMRKLLLFISVCFLLNNCNDGDIITVELEFDDTFKECEVNESVVFYKTKSDPSESLSLKLSTTIDDLIELDATNQLVNPDQTFTINGSSNTFNYRTYASTLPSSYFCEAVTPNVIITSDSESTTGSVSITTVLTEDDNDGIPAELEDINGNGDLDDDDSDNDGLPNYLDDDDDGDNVKTSTEKPNYSESNGLTNALDTDLDGIPNYLDDDDDNDGVLTRDEENESADLNPTNDITDNLIGPDYLNDQITNVVPATAFRVHTIKQTYTITVEIFDFSFTNLTQDELDFGTLSPKPTTDRTLTPDFN